MQNDASLFVKGWPLANPFGQTSVQGLKVTTGFASPALEYRCPPQATPSHTCSSVTPHLVVISKSKLDAHFTGCPLPDRLHTCATLPPLVTSLPLLMASLHAFACVPYRWPCLFCPPTPQPLFSYLWSSFRSIHTCASCATGTLFNGREGHRPWFLDVAYKCW